MEAEFREDSLGFERNDVSSWIPSGGGGLKGSIRDGKLCWDATEGTTPFECGSWHWAQYGEVLTLATPISPLHPKILGHSLLNTVTKLSNPLKWFLSFLPFFPPNNKGNTC